MASDVALAIILQRTREQNDAIAERLENSPRGQVVLCRQNFRRGHESDLISVLNGYNRRLKRDDRLAGTYIALQQAAHGVGLGHVGGDLAQDTLLRVCGMEWKDAFDRIAHLVVQAKSNSGLSFLLAPLEFKPKFDKEQLFENEPNVGGSASFLQRLEAFSWFRPVNLP